jgi:hypothetical protein
MFPFLRRLVAQDVREEGHQLPERHDVSHSPGSDVLHPATHASRRNRVRVEVQYERPVGWKLERHPCIRAPA